MDDQNQQTPPLPQNQPTTPEVDAEAQKVLDELKNNSKRAQELDQAKAELLKAIKNEEFEVAAALRDKIKFLEKKAKDLK